jgi:hypothetical protein
VLTIVALFVSADKINHRKNGFMRLFPPAIAELITRSDVKYNSYYIAGYTKTHLYLGSVTDPSYILISNYDLSDTTHITVPLPAIAKSAFDRLSVSVDSPYINFTDGESSYYYRVRFPGLDGSLNNLKGEQFITARAISPRSIILKQYNRNLHESFISKKTLDTITRTKNYALVKQVDGLFCSDGMLNFDPSTGKLIYVYYYRNQFVCLDTNLELQLTGKTIDTNSRAKIKVESINSTGQTTLSKPPLIVNRLSCVAGDYLFVNSTLMANNETKLSFDESSVIDAYNLTDGSYKLSFYLPSYNGMKIYRVYVFGKLLFGFYDHYVLVFRLHFPIDIN